MSDSQQTENTDASPVPPVEAPAHGSFADMGLGPDVLKAVEQMGFSAPMEVQARAVPAIRRGGDLLVQSRTGSGKTAAFGIPLVDGVVDPDQKFVQAIILLPTRELALQVAAELARLATFRSLTVVPVYGGAPMGRQIEQLKAGGQIVCGTPGRVLDHLRRGTLKLDRVRCAVLDECDEMLSMGFQEDIENILEHTPADRQTLLFSATVPDGIKRLSRRFMRDPEHMKLSQNYVGVQEIDHNYYSVSGGNREADLSRILDFENPGRTIIFCNTREETGRVAEYLRGHGRDAEAISSDLSQSDRERVMSRMRAGDIQFMVATDVAARGIDLDDITHVFNFTFPESPEVYIHRTGRTGRAGRHGRAVSLIGPTEIGAFYYLKLLYKIKPQERTLPSQIEIRSRREGEHVENLRAKLPPEPGAAWRSLARRVMTALDGERLVAGLLAERLEGGARTVGNHRESGQTAGETRDEGRTRAAHADRAAAHADADTRTGDRSRSHQRERERDRGRFDRDRDGRRRDRDRNGRREVRRHEGQEDRAQERPEMRPDARPETRGEDTANRNPAPRTGQARPDRAATDYMDVWAAGPTTPPAREEPVVGDDRVRLYLNLGRKDRATVDEIASLTAALGVTVALHDIDVMNTHAYLNVDPQDAEALLNGLNGRDRQGRALVCERARPRR